jgi:NADH-quinone oxidoreductase subunit M
MAALAATGVILSATYMLWMFQRVNYGPVSEKNASLPDLKPREWVILVPVIAMTVIMGVFPNLFLQPMAPSIERMLAQMRRGTQIRVQAEPVVPGVTLVPASPAAPDGGGQ